MCNAWGHPPGCDCGFGGVYYPPAPGSLGDHSTIPEAGASATWSSGDFCRPTTCPKCRVPVFFVRHNGGSVWFDDLGQPWPKHPCMAGEPDMIWLQRCLAEEIEPGHRRVFGVVTEARVVEPRSSAHFVIRCSDGTVIADDFGYMLNPCAAVGELVALELSPDGKVEASRFKAIQDKRAGGRSHRSSASAALRASLGRIRLYVSAVISLYLSACAPAQALTGDSSRPAEATGERLEVWVEIAEGFVKTLPRK